MNHYRTNKNLVNRLIQNYKDHKKIIVAVDFDDTVFPYLKDNNCNDIIDLLHRCQTHNFHIVCFTASDPARFPIIEKFFRDQELTITGINKNPIEFNNPIGVNGKIYYNVLLDDKAGLDQVYVVLSEFLDLLDNRSI